MVWRKVPGGRGETVWTGINLSGPGVTVYLKDMQAVYDKDAFKGLKNKRWWVRSYTGDTNVPKLKTFDTKTEAMTYIATIRSKYVKSR